MKGRTEISAADDTFFMGVDGGATRCRARLRGSSGQLLAGAEGPAANVYVDFDRALAVVNEVVSRAMAEAGLSIRDRARTALGLGLAGVAGEQKATQVASALSGWRRARAANDAITACIGAHAGADGGLVIAGTGSAGVARLDGREVVVGGRGFLLGDDGSAARIGADALRAALRAHDGLQRMTELSQALISHFGGDPRAMSEWALRATPSDYGAFAPLVLAAAKEGDATAGPIVGAAVHALGALASAVRALGASQVAMVGGLSGAIRSHMSAELDASMCEPLFDAADGAILLVGGVLPDAFERRAHAGE